MIEAFAPAKINLTLHVTGRRDNGYHELDSLVVFADIGDRIEIELAETSELTVEGPMAKDVPEDDGNLVMRAARLMGLDARIRLQKFLPNAAGLGGGSSDAAAVLRALSQLSGYPVPKDALSLGADVPACLSARGVRMRGIGEDITPVMGLPALHAVLINPAAPVPTKDVFARLETPANAPMPDDLPLLRDPGDAVAWLRSMRNDLEAPAQSLQPVIGQVLETLSATPGCQLARMSGSGATCFGIYFGAETAASAAGRLREGFPGWWVAATRLNAPS
ncbi:MAG: 4-(cytidine 5'-diphospho)-2-C-methyl-D-erythritol kinase [Pseudomonadota bacterium]|uniref:4-(cytidine 5'-diphospho)-2-C-methyl-D-erythritol kinase n=1 Tax=Roseovarius TaxID=74030 RepID=UPI0022A8BEF7|nr:4-(cytidine 5'-diphospho)-2-C-methyl-D-erythritol kinase [Roseovarius sp. EGI FJ00037]MCZ0813890.1 4-(cytidine 5'-diphospho)-2-C-methyl-D-erythritol kinase [Roseovarius sp. EGI FJ00037]